MKWHRQGEAWSLIHNEECLLLIYRLRDTDDWSINGLVPGRVKADRTMTEDQVKAWALRALDNKTLSIRHEINKLKVRQAKQKKREENEQQASA
jgi:hypothetical protein